MFQNEIITSMDELKEKSTPINSRIEQIQFAITQSTRSNEIVEDVQAMIEEYSQSLSKLIKEKALDNTTLKQLIKEIRVYPDGKRILEMNLPNDIGLKINMPLEITIPVCQNRTFRRFREVQDNIIITAILMCFRLSARQTTERKFLGRYSK